MNKEGLEGAFLEEGVTKAMSELGGEKAPGPDEFLLAFSKFCWSIVGGEVLANKLKRVIDKVVLYNQNAFVGGRNILDTTLVVNKAINLGKQSSNTRLVCKLGIEKTYNGVN